jgi:hypothetical protein
LGFWGKLTKPRAKLELAVEKAEYSLGEELRASVTVVCEDEFDIEGIAAGLRCWESVRKARTYVETDSSGEDQEYEEEYWDRALLFSKSLTICDKMHITAGFSSSFPFSIQIPSSGRATYHSIDQRLLWLIAAEMHVIGRRHIKTGNREINVAKPSTTVKEIIREVVLVPCAYCGGLMPQTSLFCPNCGARRKV